MLVKLTPAQTTMRNRRGRGRSDLRQNHKKGKERNPAPFIDLFFAPSVCAHRRRRRSLMHSANFPVVVAEAVCGCLLQRRRRRGLLRSQSTSCAAVFLATDLGRATDERPFRTEGRKKGRKARGRGFICTGGQLIGGSHMTLGSEAGREGGRR